MVTGHHGNEQQRSPPDEASGRSSSNAVLRMRPPGDRAAAIPTGGDLVGVPSMVGKSIIADRASDVHTPSFSCQRCAHTKLFLPSMCT